jgi:hypothetical protein
MTAGQALGILGDVPRLTEETAASLRSLKSLEGKLTPEEMAMAKKRLFRAGATYYAPTIAATGALGLSIAARAAKNPAVAAGAGMGGYLIGQLGGPLGSLYAAKQLARAEGGRMMTGDEIKSLHQEMAPELALALSEKPSPAGAFYMHAMSPRAKFRRSMATAEMKELGLRGPEAKDFLDRGGIFMAKTWTPSDLHRILVESEIKNNPWLSAGSKKKQINKQMKKFEEKEAIRKKKLELEEKAKSLRTAQKIQAA